MIFEEEYSISVLLLQSVYAHCIKKGFSLREVSDIFIFILKGEIILLSVLNLQKVSYKPCKIIHYDKKPFLQSRQPYVLIFLITT